MQIPTDSSLKIGVLIRFKNSAKTLPAVLAALRRQTIQPDLIVGVDTGSTDGSAELMRAKGAQIVNWLHPYHHSKVLNFGLTHCPAARVLVLSSHTVLESPDALARLNEALDDPETACASLKWDSDGYYSDAIDWTELAAKGLKLGSIYSNSFGLLRRARWEELPFDETVPTMEDYVWSVEQVRRGYRCCRVESKFSYQRDSHARDFAFGCRVFALAAQTGLEVRWLGRKSTVREMLKLLGSAFSPKPQKRAAAAPVWSMHRARLLASLAWRWNGASA